jgi:hypothetical protein
MGPSPLYQVSCRMTVAVFTISSGQRQMTSGPAVLGGVSIDLLLLCEVLGLRFRGMSFRVREKVSNAALYRWTWS